MTPGQRLYEMKHPKYITVYRTRHPWAEPLIVESPETPVPWEFLTERCRQSYETEAKTHHLTYTPTP